MILRAYQQSIFNQIIESSLNDLVQLDTGAGKTPVIARLAEHYQDAVIVCHRNILIKQASEKLAMCGLKHRIVASSATKRISASNNINKVGAHYIDPKSRIELVSIDTINSQVKRGKLSINKNSKILLVDEAHHLADDNKWAALADKLGVRCVGFTATPCRGDGYPMIKQYGGFFDRIVQAEGYENNATERLISEGYLAEYSAYLTSVADTAQKYGYGTEYLEGNNKKLKLIGSSYYAYDKWADSKQAIVIESRIANAVDALSYFKRFGINADVIHSNKPQYEIERILQAFEAKKIKVLIAVDMINEGFDVPDADVLILARVVQSFGLYRQLCGRVLRPRKGKCALILDLNGSSIAKHGLPSDPVDWTARQGQIKRKNLTVCKACGLFFKATLTACPECGEHNDIERHKGVGSAMEVHFFDAAMVKRERKRLELEEEKRLKEIEKQKELERSKNTYLEFSTGFSVGIVGKRCKHFYDTLQDVLKKELEPFEYNEFFKRNNSKMGAIDFYAGIITPDFDKHKKEQCLKLYKVKK